MQAVIDRHAEERRVAELAQYGMTMDREEADFTQLASLVARIFEAPIAGISVVDDSHVWLKGRHGVDLNCLQREGAFCSLAVDSAQELFEVPDARRDARFRMNALVLAQPNVRAYMAAVLFGQRGYPLGTLWFMDVKPRKLSESERDLLRGLAAQAVRLMELRYLAGDSGLAARSAFVTNLQCAITQSRGGSQACRIAHCSRLAPDGRCTSQGVQHRPQVGYVLLRNLHLIKSLYGSVAGGKFMQRIAKVLQSWAHSGDMLAQVDVDGFAFALFDGGRGVDDRLRELMVQLNRPINLEGELLTPEASVGMAYGEAVGSIASSLLDQAAAAARIDPERGRLAVGVFGSELREVSERRIKTQRSIGECVAQRFVLPRYQPQVDAAAGKMIGFEALARLKHPSHGILMPNEFVDLAIADGTIGRIDMLMLEAVCRDMVSWRERGLPLLPVAINFSRVSLLNDRVVESVLTTLEELEIPAELISIELTESGLAQAPDILQQRVHDLKRSGLEVALDDFGTGLSNLDTLRSLDFNCIKADRLYVHGASVNLHTGALLRVISSIADLFGVRLVCEGVEDERDLRWAMDLGCRYFQGWYFAADGDADSVGRALQLLETIDPDTLASNPAALARLLQREFARKVT